MITVLLDFAKNLTGHECYRGNEIDEPLDVLTPSSAEDSRYTWNGTVYSALREEIQSLGLWRLARPT